MIISFDGIKGAGKTTLITMLEAHSLDAVVVRENDHDPLRSMTKRAYAIANGVDCEKGQWDDVALTMSSRTREEDITLGGECDNVLEYAIQYNEDAERSQAILAYLFTLGRKSTNYGVDALVSEKHDVILDRWQLSGWAEQWCGRHHWRVIRELNTSMGIRSPHEQFIVLYPREDIAERRRIREAHGVKKKWQRTIEQDCELINNYMIIWRELEREDRQPRLLYNDGPPTMDFDRQVEQAYATYTEKVVPWLSAKGYRFNAPRLELTDTLKEKILQQQRAE